MHEEEFDLEKAIAKYDSELAEEAAAEREAKDEAEYDLEAAIERAKEIGDEYDSLVIKWEIKSDAYKPAIKGKDFLNRPKKPIVAYMPGLIYAGAIQAIVGPPKAGKSTFIWSMLAELMEQRSFLGEQTKLPGNVLYVSEQSEFSFDAQLTRLPAGLRERILGNSKFYMMLPEHHSRKILNQQETSATSWLERLILWKTAIKKTEADVFVLDTFNQYADLGPQGENDNAKLAQRIMELRQLQKEHPRLAVLLVCHTTKASGRKRFLELGDIRGGSALAGGLDHGVTFNKTHDGGNARFVNMESRMQDDQKRIVVRLENGSYMEVGDYTISELQEELKISRRQAYKLKQQLDPENYGGETGESGTEDHKLEVKYI